MKRIGRIMAVAFAAVLLFAFAAPAQAGGNIGIQFGSAGSFGDIGTVVELQKQPNSSKENLVLSSPLSIEINIDNNNSPSDQVIFTAGSGSNKKTIAILDQNGNLRLKGKVYEDAF
ncbi:MAG: hypothetical protein F6J93_27355 [Oscillatoria sp. SIO1A7]|nr:hypothetical protein [Oscillatoria sp. SIO1A7]